MISCLIVDQEGNHIGFMRLQDTVLILYGIHVRIDYVSDSSSLSYPFNSDIVQMASKSSFLLCGAEFPFFPPL